MVNLLHANDRRGEYPASYYAATRTDLDPFPALLGEAKADVAVVGGGFMKITNNGKTADRLVSASSPNAREVQMHTMSMEGGVMKMRQLKDGIVIPAGQTVELKPGSLHVMFMGIKAPFKKGSKIPATLKFKQAGSVKVQFTVQAVGSTMPMEAGHAQH